MNNGYRNLPVASSMEMETAGSDTAFVKWLQASLNKVLGLSLAVDGIAGTQTRNAIRQFQQLKGLLVDGIAGTQTVTALRAALGSAPTPYIPPPRPTPTPYIPPPRPTPTPTPSLPNIQDQVRRWFVTGGSPPMQPVRPDNLAIPLVGGAQAFREMVRAIRTANAPGHYIYLLGWILYDNFQLIPGDTTSTIASLFATASSRGVQVRAMLWDQLGTQNTAEVDRIDRLPNGAAILDNRTLNFGSHHQKILVVKGNEGLIAFCGGVDINPDRINASSGGGSSSGSGSGGSGTGGAPLQDVHCRITGLAAHDLLRIFMERWSDHPDHSARDSAKGTLLGAREPLPAPAGKMYVQIARTYGNGTRNRGIGSGGYRFAPNGERTIQRMVENAIRQARKFIYLEDQYLINMEISAALVSALPNIQHLTIVIPHAKLYSGQECPSKMYDYQKRFISPLRSAGGNKVRVFCPSPAGAPNTYVHSKMWIFDDEFAIIGSANVNRRSYTHDSEVTAGIYDPAPRSAAKQLRIWLWAKHLNLQMPANQAALEDGVAAGALWLSLSPGARVAPFSFSASVPGDRWPQCFGPGWTTIVDPFGG
ncbi:MAG: phospholipase D/transphosphatidylase [Chloroflexi bacterium]|nr:phospholipase D/transphosphatidylase [Chloroflexota bacterium]